MRRLLALVAIVALAVLAGSSLAGAVAGPADPTTSVTATSESTSEFDGAVTRVAVDDDALPLRSHSVLPSTSLLVQRPHVLPRALILLFAVIATALIGQAVRHALRVSNGWSPRSHVWVDGAPLRGPPQGTVPALGI